MRVLVAEDSQKLRETIAQALREALIHAQTSEYDVIILDLGLPELDGMEVLRRIREKGMSTHVLILTARDSVQDRVLGLDTGADDYLVKPFALAELVARVRTLARRAHQTHAPTIRVGPLAINTQSRTASLNDGPALDLAPREYAVLEYLALRAGKPVPRAELEEHLYDERSQVQSNAIDVAIYLLRARLDAAGAPPLIHTRRKVGYVLAEREP